MPCSKRTRKEKLPLPKGGTWESVFPDEWEWETPRAHGKRKQGEEPVERATSPRLESNEDITPADRRRFTQSGNMFDGLGDEEEEDMEDGEVAAANADAALDPDTDAAIDEAMQDAGSALLDLT